MTNEAQATCFGCFGTLKSFHELIEIVKSNYKYEDISLVKCEVFETDCLTVTELPILQCEVFKEEHFDEIEENFNKVRKTAIYDSENEFQAPEDAADDDFVPGLTPAAKRKKLKLSKANAKEALKKPKPPSEPSNYKRYPKISVDEQQRRQEQIEEDNEKIRSLVEVKCHLCSIPFETFFQIHKHFKTSHPDYDRCFLMCCGRKFKRRYELLDHLKSHESAEKFKCSLCTSSFRTPRTLKSHVTAMHRGEPQTCTVCQKVCRNEGALKSHMKFHEFDFSRTYECYQCAKKFQNLAHLKLHFSKRHRIEKEVTLVCDVCSKVFSSRAKFRSHVSYHNEQEVIERGEGFKCNQCEKVFGAEKKLKMHINQVHANQTIICEICSRPLKSINSLKSHIQTVHEDLGDQPRVPCLICGNLMKNQRSLEVHLKKHRASETDNVCKECGHHSASKGALWNHVRLMHRLQRNLPCQYCPKMLKTELDVKEHEATHTGIDLYQCEFCPQTFKFGASYRGHRKRQHPDEYKPKWRP